MCGEEIATMWLLLGSGLVLLCLILTYAAALCCSVVKNASMSSLKSMEETPAVQKAVKIKGQADSFGRRLKACAVFHAVMVVWLSAVLYGIPLANVFGAVMAKVSAVIVSELLISIPVSAVLLMTVYLLPHRAAEHEPEKTLMKLYGLIAFWEKVFWPLSALGSGLTMIAAKIFLRNIKPEQPPENPTEEKILMMVDEGEVNGTIEVNTKSMIENVFDFDDTTVGEIMTHRKDIIAIREDDTLAHLRQLAIDSGRSRIPVYHEDIDDIIGIVYVKDLLQYVGRDTLPEVLPQSIVHTAAYVPASKSCSEMFRYMTAHKTQVAVVVDEFGGTAGLITMEDLIESILGNIQDEYDHEDDSIRKVNEYSFQVDGATPLDEIEELAGIELPESENDTIAGFMLDRMGHIPKSGEHPSIMINGTRFTVLEVDGRRISRVLVVKKNES